MEGGKIFGSGSRAPIAITLFVKNPKKAGQFTLQYHDIGDYYTRDQKLEKISKYQTFTNIPWTTIQPNKEYDWINQRDEKFGTFIPIGDRDSKGENSTQAIFINHSLGVATNRDDWSYNYSSTKLADNMKGMISTYNRQISVYGEAKRRNPNLTIEIEKLIDNDPKKIKWTDGLKSDLVHGKPGKYEAKHVRLAHYRPFTKHHLYFDRQFVHRPYQIPKLFPASNTKNIAICVTGTGATKDFSALMTDITPDLELISKNQCFPLYTFSSRSQTNEEFDFGNKDDSGTINISEFAKDTFRQCYKAADLSSEDIFYYIYGVLHSQEYKRRFEPDLSKMLPRIPFAEDFFAFAKAGRKLSGIHLNYETAKPYPVREHSDELRLDSKRLYEVQKMRFGKKGKEIDKSTIQYNSHLILMGIPLAAYEYVVNGKPAIEWIMERYQFSKDKDSGIINDPNDWAREHNDPQYILNLLKKIITVSVETMKIVKSLPPLNERN